MLEVTRKSNFRLRVIFAGLVLGLMYGVVVARAVDLMIVQGPQLKEMARRQHHRVMRLTPLRGSILDRNGMVLAESVPVESVYAHPNKVNNPAATANVLASILDEKEERMLEKLASSGKFIWIKRAVTPEQAETIKRNDLDGIVVIGEYARYYPQGSLAAQLIGFVGAYGEGLEGLERKYNELLAGSEESLVVQRDARGKPLYRSPESLPEPGGGDDIVLTIDARIQAVVEESLEKAVESSEAKSGIAAVMETRSGKILAMATWPEFNPNHFRKYSQESYRNRVVADVFEPGSTFKIFTLAAMVDSGQGGIYDEIFCEDGAYELDGSIINDTHAYGWFTVEEIIVHSSNIGAAKIGLKVGRDIMSSYISDFGFGKSTGIDLPGESGGIVRPFKNLSRVGLANIAFGQGIGVTGIQLISALNAIAAGGEYRHPKIIERIRNADGSTVRAVESDAPRRVASTESSRRITHVLANVVHGGGTGKKAAPVGYTVAGKTGTAQKVNFETGGYYGDRYVASFMGWAPAENPEITVIVVVDDPKGKPWGGTIAAPAFREIVERTLPMLGVLPDKEIIARHMLDERMSGNATFSSATQEAASNNNEGIVAGDGSSGNAIPDPCDNCMPDLVGLPLRKVLGVAGDFGVSVEIVGSGRVCSQLPPPGSRLDGIKKWRVELTVGPN